MNPGEGSGIPPAQSYPSPTPQQMGVSGLSYYGNQHPLSAEEQIQQQLSGAVRPDMGEGMNNGSNMMGSGQGSQEFGPHTASPQMAQGHYDANPQGASDLHHDLSYGEQSARRKRSKVSRACDECRRKKIRCDATNESGVERCSNCQRTNLQCQFSRVPMKRGPSKGYIKELAERLNSLENQMQPIQGMSQNDMQYQGVNEDGSPGGYEQYSPDDEGSLSRKRTFSMAEGTPIGYPGQFQQRDRMSSISGWSNQGQTGPAGQSQRASFSVNDPPSQGGQGFQVQRPSFSAPEPPSQAGPAYQSQRASFSMPEPPSLSRSTYRIPRYPISGPEPTPYPKADDVAPPFWFEGSNIDPAALDASEGVQTNPDFKWDDPSIEAYYKTIHPILPVLHHSRADLRKSLSKCSLTLRDSFLALLYSTVRVATEENSAANPVEEVSIKQALDVLQLSQLPKKRTVSVSLIYLQCLVLAILEADHRGPDNLLGKNGTTKTQLLQMAVGVGHVLVKQLNLEAPRELESDPDSDKNLIRRNWIILVVLDRFHAVSVGNMKTISPPMTNFSVVDKKVLGNTLFYLADLTDIMSQLADLMDMQKTPSPTESLLSRPQAIKDLLETGLDRVARFQNIIPPQKGDQVSGNPNFDTNTLLWWQLLLLTKRYLYITHPSEILAATKILVDILKHQTSSGPFHMHFYALAAVTLLELTDVADCEDEAWKVVSEFLSALDHRRAVPAVPSSRPQSPKTTNGKHAGESSEKSYFIYANVTLGWDEAIRNLVDARQQEKAHAFSRPGSSHQIASPTANANSTSPTTEPGRSLQQLADLAEKVGGSENAQDAPAPGAPEGRAATESTNIDFGLLNRFGYLNVVAQGWQAQ